MSQLRLRDMKRLTVFSDEDAQLAPEILQLNSGKSRPLSCTLERQIDLVVASLSSRIPEDVGAIRQLWHLLDRLHSA